MAVSVWITIVYAAITAMLGVHMMVANSFIAAIAAIAACTLCFVGAADFVGSFRARHAINYTAKNLAATGVLATILIASGIILTIASGLSLDLFGVAVGGVYWALCGVVAATAATREEHGIALDRFFAG